MFERRNLFRFPAALASALCAWTTACSNASPKPDAGTGGTCVQFSDDASLTTPTVSFKNDVMPLFEQSCGLSSACHSDQTTVMQRGVFLGCEPNVGTCSFTSDPAQAVYAELLGPNAAAPLEESCMPFIKPGDPTHSYLMHKMDGDMACAVPCCITTNTAASSVSEMGCGALMPYLGAELPAQPVCGEPADCGSLASETRDTVRAWIKQGALNN